MIYLGKEILINSGFVQDTALEKTKESIINDVYILITDKTISDIFKLKPVFEIARKKHKNLLVIAHDFFWKTLADVQNYKKIYSLDCVCIKTPSTELDSIEFLHDIAILAGGKVFSDDFTNVTKEHLGKAETVRYTAEQTIIINPSGKNVLIKKRINEIEDNIAKTTSDYEREWLIKRLRNLVDYEYEPNTDNDINIAKKATKNNSDASMLLNNTNSSAEKHTQVKTPEKEKTTFSVNPEYTEQSHSVAPTKKSNKESNKTQKQPYVRLLRILLGSTYGVFLTSAIVIFSYMYIDPPHFGLSAIPQIISDYGGLEAGAMLDIALVLFVNFIPTISGFIIGAIDNTWKGIGYIFLVPVLALIASIIPLFLIAGLLLFIEGFAATLVFGIVFLGFVFGGGTAIVIIFK